MHPARVGRREHIHVRGADDDATEEDAERRPEAEVRRADGVVEDALLGRRGRDERRVGREQQARLCARPRV